MVFQLKRFSCPFHARTYNINSHNRLSDVIHSNQYYLFLTITFSFSLLYLDPPINVTMVSFGWSFAVLNWTSPFHSRAIDFADLYRVIARSSEGEVTITTTQTHARIDGLKQLTNYSLNAQAWNGLGYGPFLVTGIPFRTPGK